MRCLFEFKILIRWFLSCSFCWETKGCRRSCFYAEVECWYRHYFKWKVSSFLQSRLGFGTPMHFIFIWWNICNQEWWIQLFMSKLNWQCFYMMQNLFLLWNLGMSFNEILFSDFLNTVFWNRGNFYHSLFFIVKNLKILIWILNTLLIRVKLSLKV